MEHKDKKEFIGGNFLKETLFSDHDPWVPLENQNDYRDKLGSEIIIEHNKGHFSGSNGVRELPIVLEKILKI